MTSLALLLGEIALGIVFLLAIVLAILWRANRIMEQLTDGDGGY